MLYILLCISIWFEKIHTQPEAASFVQRDASFVSELPQRSGGEYAGCPCPLGGEFLAEMPGNPGQVC